MESFLKYYAVINKLNLRTEPTMIPTETVRKRTKSSTESAREETDIELEETNHSIADERRPCMFLRL